MFVQKKISRRILLQLIAPSALTVFGGIALPGCAGSSSRLAGASESPGLGDLARESGRVFGVAVQSRQLHRPDFAKSLTREAALLAPERELKWNVLRPSAERFDFSFYEKIAGFAGAHHMAMRGHTLVWHRANPKWLMSALAKKRGREALLDKHIRRVITETATHIRDWDVVNEPVHPMSTRTDGLRSSPWLAALGPEYIPLAFHLAHAADENLTLTLNEYGLEYGDGNGITRRAYMLRLLEKMKREEVPIHRLGLQSHLQAHRPLGGKNFLEFLKEIRGLGLDVTVTELDLDTSRLTGRADDVAKLGQNYLRTYLGMVQESGDVKTLVTWGLSDRTSWIHETMPGLKGMLPLDADLRRNAMWESLRAAWL